MSSPERVALDTPLGRLTGLRWHTDASSTGVRRFAGIPYAEPPAGARRFRAPEPARGWSGERDATDDALAQPQTRGGPELVPGMVPAATGDDSLSLTIWAPDGARALPVMVWIHGGSFTIGSSSLP